MVLTCEFDMSLQVGGEVILIKYYEGAWIFR